MDENNAFQNLVDDWGKRTPDNEAIFDGYQRISYKELSKEIQKVTHALSQKNIQKGDKIMTFIPNWYEFIVLFFTLAKLGAILIPCHSNLVDTELEIQIQRIRPKAVFVAQTKYLPVLQKHVDLSMIFTVRFQKQGLASYSELIVKEDTGKVRQACINPYEDAFMIMFTSGTTGIPKGVVSTYNNLFESAKNLGYRLKCTSDDTFLVPLPTAHMFGIITGILLPFYFGGKIVLMEKHDPRTALELIEKEKITVHYGVPTMFIREIEEYRQKQTNIETLRTGIVAGAAVPKHLMEQIYKEFQCRVMIAYGSTESIAVSCTCFEDPIDKIFETVGRVFNGNQLEVIDDQGNVLGTEKTGELLCKGFGIMKGYYEMPEETRKAIDENGWFHTGDLATVDDLGYIRIVGRKSDFIMRGGNKISLQEVENIYYKHPDVLHVCVLGHADKVLGEMTYAYIELKTNSRETEETLKNYATEYVSRYKIPDRIILLEKMPMLENGKINKKGLLENNKDNCLQSS